MRSTRFYTVYKVLHGYVTMFELCMVFFIAIHITPFVWYLQRSSFYVVDKILHGCITMFELCMVFRSPFMNSLYSTGSAAILEQKAPALLGRLALLFFSYLDLFWTGADSLLYG